MWIDPGAFVVVVGFDPVNDLTARTSFRTEYHLDNSVRLFGPWRGKLANEGEPLLLMKPDIPQPPGKPDQGYVPLVVVDRLEYSSSLPWPAAANGAGLSLQRIVPLHYGNEPLNWQADSPTPGTPNVSESRDSDGDGLPDPWELTNGLDPFVGSGMSGADGDPDGDGLTNLQEYRAWTDPRGLTLLIIGISPDGGQLRVTYNGIAGVACAIEVCDTLPAFDWQLIGETAAPQVTEPASFYIDLDPALPSRYFRLRVSPWELLQVK